MRHAETVYNAKQIFCGRIDCGLSEQGRKDALNNPHYQKTDFDVYYCSPLKRSLETLKLIIPDVENVIIDSRITEISIGDWEGKPKAIFPKDLVAAYRLGVYTPPNAEPTSAVDQRVIDFITEILATYDENTKILVITHNGVMRSIKRNFVPNYNNIMSGNLDCITINRNNYKYFLGKKNKHIQIN